MVRIAEQRRIAIAARDERTVYSGVTLIRAKFHLHHAEATRAIAAAKRRVGPTRTAELLRLNRRANLSALLLDAESKWPGVLESLRVEPYRRVAERYTVAITPIWRVRSRLKELCSITGLNEEDAVRAILNDIRGMAVARDGEDVGVDRE